MAEEPAAATGGQAGDYVTLAKPRLNLLVVATTLAGYYMAAPHGLGWALLLHTLIGTPPTTVESDVRLLSGV